MTDTEKILDILASMQLNIGKQLESIHTRLDSVETAVLKTNVKIETDIEVKLQALYEGQMNIIEQLTPRSRIDEMEDKIKFLESALHRMSEDVERLKKAQ